MTGERSYGDQCGVARGLDVVGERWALLITRELLLGPKRFTDLRGGLPGASPNVLSQRLRQLEKAGVLRRRRLGAPASAWVYELTEWGEELEPVVLALGRWGARAPAVPDAELSPDALIVALRTTFDRRTAGGLRATWELRLGDERFRVAVAEGRLEVARGSAGRPDAVLQTDVATLRALVFGGRPLDEALAAGAVVIEGDWRAAFRFLGLFARPEPVLRT